MQVALMPSEPHSRAGQLKVSRQLHGIASGCAAVKEKADRVCVVSRKGGAWAEMGSLVGLHSTGCCAKQRHCSSCFGGGSLLLSNCESGL